MRGTQRLAPSMPGLASSATGAGPLSDPDPDLDGWTVAVRTVGHGQPEPRPPEASTA